VQAAGTIQRDRLCHCHVMKARTSDDPFDLAKVVAVAAEMAEYAVV